MTIKKKYKKFKKILREIRQNTVKLIDNFIEGTTFLRLFLKYAVTY